MSGENVPFHDRPVYPRGFRGASRRCGVKPAGPDLAVLHTRAPAAAAAVFTRNRFPGAPVVVGREVIRRGRLRAVVVNSGNANVATGDAGIEDARRVAAVAARELGIPQEEVLPSSTGIIGRRLPVERIEAGLRGIGADLGDDPLDAARGMMTTDTHPKALSLPVGDATLTVVAKGSGMVAPEMATMLAFVLTDARVAAPALDGELRDVVDGTFNMLSVDGDTSTSDTCAILANGLAGPVDAGAFREALGTACTRMTEILARDGEGATRLLRVRVSGAPSVAEARSVARSLVESPLVKTMAYGGDPNVGRLVMAVGKRTGASFEPREVSLAVEGIPVFAGGACLDFDGERVRAALEGDRVEIGVELGAGPGEATAWGCDLTEGYVAENAAYSSS